MNLKSLFLLLLGFVSLQGQATEYNVTVYGILVDGSGKGIGDKIIHITSPDNAPFKVAEQTKTYPGGEFKWPVNIPDSINQGVLLISFENCEGKKIVKESRFSKENPLIQVKLIYCDKKPDTPCTSAIVVRKVNEELAIAHVITKGTPPFKHLWSTGQDGDSIKFNPLKDLRICVGSIDANGCISAACLENAPPKPCGTVILVKRINDTAALAIVQSRGVAPFETTWSTGEKGDTLRFNPTAKVKICVRVVDATGCVSEACVPGVPAACQAYIERDGNVLYAFLKGDDAKSYRWNTGADGPKLEIKEPGEYCVNILGLNGCESKACFIVKDLNPSVCKAAIVTERIVRDSPSVVVGMRLTIKADFDLKFIKWNTGDTSKSIEVRKSGEYCAIVSDGINCKANICQKVELPVSTVCGLTILQDRTPNTGDLNFAKIKLTAKPTFIPTLYSWSTGQTTPSIIVEKSGEYCVTVSDGLNCKLRECVKIELNNLPLACGVSIIVKPMSAKEVKLVPRVTGQAPMKYKWSTGSNDATISVTQTGKYCISVVDGAGCQSTDCVEIEIESGAGLTSPGGDKNKVDTNGRLQTEKISLSVYPNPSPDKVIYEVITDTNHNGTISIMNLYGKMVYKENIGIQAGAGRGDLDLSFLPPGVYQIVFEQQGVMKTKKLVIGR